MNTATATNDNRLDETFAALANSTRRAILARLAEGEASVNDLAEPFNMTLPAISRHIKVLEHAGLITRGRRAQFRPCTIAAEPLAEIADWANQYRHIWDESFDRMDDYVQTLKNDYVQTLKNTQDNKPKTNHEHDNTERDITND